MYPTSMHIRVLIYTKQVISGHYSHIHHHSSPIAVTVCNLLRVYCQKYCYTYVTYQIHRIYHLAKIGRDY
jgi:hypothetical protein